MSATDPLSTQLPQLYNINIQRATTFTYLGVPFNQNGCINNVALIDSNTTAMVSAMNILASIGVRARCLGKLLSTRLYHQFIRPKMEYGLAITKFTHKDCKILQASQNTCLQKIYGTKTNQSMAVIHHLANLKYMTDRVTTLQAKFILRSYNMPDDALFPTLLPRAKQTKGLRAWNTFVRKNTIWQSITATTTEDSIAAITTKDLKNATKQHLKTTHTQHCQHKNSKLLNQCRKHLGIDPILWLPMTPQERILCIYYRLGWINNHHQQPCPNCHQTTRISKQHLLSCHHVHTFLSISTNINDPISYVINRLPKSPPASFNKWLYLKIIWPKLCYILHQLHRTCRPEQYTTVTLSS